jgi:hypothetical protein
MLTFLEHGPWLGRGNCIVLRRGIIRGGICPRMSNMDVVTGVHTFFRHSSIQNTCKNVGDIEVGGPYLTTYSSSQNR